MFGNDYFRGRVNYTVEIGMVDMKSTASQELLDEKGHDLISKIGVGLTDTRGGGYSHQGAALIHRCGFRPDVLGSEKEFYGVHLKSAWYFKGLGEGHTSNCYLKLPRLIA